MKVLLVVLVLIVLYEALKSGLFASLTTGSPAVQQRQPWFTAQTPWGNFGGGA